MKNRIEKAETLLEALLIRVRPVATSKALACHRTASKWPLKRWPLTRSLWLVEMELPYN